MLKNIGVIEMKYLSVCSGIEAASAAWHSLGWQAVGFSEIEPFPCSVLEHRFPDVENFGDMTKFKEWDIEPGSVDVLVGGTPCQSFSIAGLRGGLTDGRGNLALTYCQILQKFRPRWFIWENVPGVLSSNGGRDFGSILGAMVELGYGIAYRILDAQYFGVPQRRRRVFVVGCAGDWDRAAKVLFERGCLSGNTAKGRKAKQNVAALTATGVGTCGADDNQGQAGHLIADARNGTVGSVSQTLQSHHSGSSLNTQPLLVPSITSHYGKGVDSDCTAPLITSATTQFGPVAGTLTRRHDSSPCADRGQNIVAIQERAVSTNIENGPQGAGFRDDGKAYTLEARNKVQAVAFTQNQRNEVRELDVIGALQANPGMKQQAYLSQSVGVRRLTPRECERLQGFPDDWTLVLHRGKLAADGPRYKCIGNSMAVPVMRWIGKRIDLFIG
jgi:DNA (cytosine-5)-methyltransferase 1